MSGTSPVLLFSLSKPAVGVKRSWCQSVCRARQGVPSVRPTCVPHLLCVLSPRPHLERLGQSRTAHSLKRIEALEIRWKRHPPLSHNPRNEYRHSFVLPPVPLANPPASSASDASQMLPITKSPACLLITHVWNTRLPIRHLLQCSLQAVLLRPLHVSSTAAIHTLLPAERHSLSASFAIFLSRSGVAPCPVSVFRISLLGQAPRTE